LADAVFRLLASHLVTRAVNARALTVSLLASHAAVGRFIFMGCAVALEHLISV
jgi:hypothetical protein